MLCSRCACERLRVVLSGGQENVLHGGVWYKQKPSTFAQPNIGLRLLLVADVEGSAWQLPSIRCSLKTRFGWWMIGSSGTRMLFGTTLDRK